MGSKNTEAKNGDDRLSKWVDASMDERELAEFEEEIAVNPELREEAESFRTAVEVLRRLPSAEAPDDFLTAVQSRIRRRTRGRYFGYEYKVRFPYEAAISVVLIGIMVSLYMSAPTKDYEPKSIDRSQLTTDDIPESHAKVLDRYGTVEIIDEGARYQIEIDAGELAGLKAALADSPQLQLDGDPTPIDGGRLGVRITVVERGPP